MNYIKRFFVVLGLAILSQISMTIFGGAKDIALNSGTHKLSILGVIFIIAITVGNIFLLIYLGGKLGFFRFKKDIFTKKNILYFLVGSLITITISMVGTELLKITGVNDTANEEVIGQIFTGENPIVIILLISIAAPIMEEIVFRGGIIGYLFKDIPLAGIIVSSILFGLVHGPTDIISFLIYGLFGLTCSIAYFKTKRLEVSIGIHFLNNIIGALALVFTRISS